MADLKDYAWCRADSARLALIDNLARLFNTLFAVAVLIVLAGIATVFLAMALTWALALWIGSLLYALLIIGGVFLLARWLPLVRLDLGGTLVLVVLLALSAPTLAGLIFMGERLHGMVNDWKNTKARKHV